MQAEGAHLPLASFPSLTILMEQNQKGDNQTVNC